MSTNDFWWFFPLKDLHGLSLSRTVLSDSEAADRPSGLPEDDVAAETSWMLKQCAQSRSSLRRFETFGRLGLTIVALEMSACPGGSCTCRASPSLISEA